MKSRPRNLPADQRRAATVEAVIELAAEHNPGDIMFSHLLWSFLHKSALFEEDK